MTNYVMTYDEWAASGGGVYASYDDYKRGVQAVHDYQEKLRQDQLAETIAKKVVRMLEEKRT